jgi:ribokinase
MPNLDLLLIGDVSIDEYMKIDDAVLLCDVNHENCQICFDYEDKIPVEQFGATLAGNSNNVGIGAKKLGLNVAIYCELGEDANAELFIDKYKKLDINTDFCIKNPGKNTNVHPIIVFKGERTILSYHEKYQYQVRNWGKPRWIYYTSLPENFLGFQKELVEYLKKNEDIGVAFNPGTYQLKEGPEKLKEMLEMTDILFVNTKEAKGLLPDEDVAKMAIEDVHKKLLELGPKLSVITEGKRGSSAFDGKNFVSLGLLVEDDKTVVDKTGAGDAHAAGFLSAIHYGKPLLEALKWGTLNASGVVKTIGSIAGQRTKQEVEGMVTSGAQFTEYGLEKDL